MFTIFFNSSKNYLGDYSLDTIALNKAMNELNNRRIEQAVLMKLGKNIKKITINKNNKKTDVYKVKYNGKQYQSVSYVGIINKLAEALGIIDDYNLKKLTFEQAFNKALEEKRDTENISSNTVKKYIDDYKRFINNKLGSKLITQITEIDIMAYTQEFTKSNHILITAYKSYKTLLNLVFKYAVYHDIIQKNPVDKLKDNVYKKNCTPIARKEDEKILSIDEIQKIKDEIQRRKSYKKYNGYFVKGLMVEFSIETGLRAGELCALKNDDIYADYIHIHSQQICEYTKDGKKYKCVPYTKDERGISQDGRKFPITSQIQDILNEITDIKAKKNIQSDFLFCDLYGDMIKTHSYEKFLNRMMNSLGFNVTNNHAFRMSLNSNVFIPKGIPATERAKLLGHSVQTNLKYYSYNQKDYLYDLKNILSNEKNA